ncbi:TrmH family RNA methyltransferase [Actinopolymorpha alba]|uniref:TrmH family RNA methyltransferase n=1 Tax=Actinopolymorpha alba TaxID=533267 RepID=UPI000362A614|nr:RNA methyltransferase [Actinopolymorpha alba]
MREEVSPRDRFVTVYGFRPVLAALADDRLSIDKVLVAEGARGPSLREIVAAADARAVPVRRVPPHRLTLLSGNPRHDNGVLADVVAPRMRTLATALEARPHERPQTILVLDGIKTPANVGMILRTATAAGLDGVVVPHRGVADLDPLVVKASAGVAFHAPVLRCDTAEEAAERLVEAGYTLVGLAADGSESLFEAEIPSPVAFFLGGETDGVSPAARAYIGAWVSIPMPGDVESLNVASAAAVVAFEVVRRRLTVRA